MVNAAEEILAQMRALLGGHDSWRVHALVQLEEHASERLDGRSVPEQQCGPALVRRFHSGGVATGRRDAPLCDGVGNGARLFDGESGLDGPADRVEVALEGVVALAGRLCIAERREHVISVAQSRGIGRVLGGLPKLVDASLRLVRGSERALQQAALADDLRAAERCVGGLEIASDRFGEDW